MLRRMSLFVSMTTLLVHSAYAQDKRVEVGVFGGYTFSEGVSVGPVAIQGDVFDQVDAKSGFSYGVSFDVFVTENVEVGFQWAQQDSGFVANGTTRREFAEMKIDHYHGIFTYNWGEENGVVRPYIFGGLGATSYSPGDVEGIEIESSSRFSTTWGAGVKAYPGDNVGVKFGVRWTPTYIKSDPAGVWCSPYWSPYFPGGCWVLEETDYANQLELFGGITLRF